jgi:hypothetical protein
LGPMLMSCRGYSSPQGSHFIFALRLIRDCHL